jgi:hypothetical protein
MIRGALRRRDSNRKHCILETQNSSITIDGCQGRTGASPCQGQLRGANFATPDAKVLLNERLKAWMTHIWEELLLASDLGPDRAFLCI